MRSSLVDPYGRPVRELRITVTKACNFRCIYCHREGEIPRRPYELSPEEIEQIVRVAVSLGVRRIKLTGGEPLLRQDILEIIRRLSLVVGIEEISLVTNGFYLADMAPELKEAGLSRVNVSLSTLDPAKYRLLTGVDGLSRVLKGIERAVDAELNPVKINYVYLRGLTEDDFWSLAEYAASTGVSVLRVIEYHEPFPLSENFQRFHADLSSLIEELEKASVKKEVRDLQNRPIYYLPSGLAVEVVKPMFNPSFCAACNKLRLTSDGWFKPCLLRCNGLVDAVRGLARGPEGIRTALLEAVRRRAPFFAPDSPTKEVMGCERRGQNGGGRS